MIDALFLTVPLSLYYYWLIIIIDLSIIGGMVIAVGLYGVVWGKGKDYADLTTPDTTKEIETQQLPITSSTDK